MDYQGYKLVDKIMLVCRDLAEHTDSYGWNPYRDSYQAYLVDPANKKQLETARHWATWTEYGPSHKNAETGEWEREYEIKHEPVEFEFDNNGFDFELLDCAGGSSQGGKLSFWNCAVIKDAIRFVIGINSDMLLDLLKNATFINGKCQSHLLFITKSGKVGMTVEGSDTYNQCIKDRDLKKNMKDKAVSKYSFGDKVSTATIEEVYLGTITKYYEFNNGATDLYSQYDKGRALKCCTVTKLAKPITYHLFESCSSGDSVKSIVASFEKDGFLYPGPRKTCPKRAITGQLILDCTEEEFKQVIFNKIYDYAYWESHAKDYYFYTEDRARLLYRFLSRELFGFGFEPFELNPELLAKLKDFNIKYIEE